MNTAVKGFCRGTVGVGFTQNNAVFCATDGKRDLPCCGRFSVHERKIAFLDLSLLHGTRKGVCRNGILCHKDSTAGFTVKTGDGAKDEGAITITVGKSVGEGVLKMSVRGMRRHIGRLEAHGDPFVLVQHIDGNGTGHKIRVALIILGREGKAIPRLQYRPHGDGMIVQKNTVCLSFERGDGAGGKL